MVKTQNLIIRIASVFLLLAFMLSFTSLTASAKESEKRAESRAGGKNYLAVSGISNTKVNQYSSREISFGGEKLGLKSLLINGTYYVPVRAFLGSVSNLTVNYNSSTKTLTVTGNGFYLSATDGSYAVYANDRVLFEKTPARLMSDGRFYIPAKTLAKALGLSLREGATLDFSGSINPIKHASAFYREDAVFWLSRIISAESRGEPLIGQIAVGNVIMNRVASKDFPNTIYSVIFDKKYGVQFSPTANGTIYEAPSYTSVLAAKICLEGFSVSEDVLYFMAPRYATSSWIEKNRDYVFTVKNHEFYA